MLAADCWAGQTHWPPEEDLPTAACGSTLIDRRCSRDGNLGANLPHYRSAMRFSSPTESWRSEVRLWELMNLQLHSIASVGHCPVVREAGRQWESEQVSQRVSTVYE